jgi:hypothetical protein
MYIFCGHFRHTKGRTTLIRLLFLLGHLYLSGMWFGVDPRTNINMTCVYKQLNYVFKILLTILSSILNIIGGEGGLHEHLMNTKIFTLVKINE